MEAVTCHDCLKAQAMRWKHYRNACAECQVRWLADLDSSERPAAYEQIERQVGESALKRIKELVGLEIVRQRLLRTTRESA
jgi:hypothetical protein